MNTIRIEEVASHVGVSVKTINNWYKFKEENMDNEYAKILPDYTQEYSRSPKLWDPNDIDKLIEFRDKIPKGRLGVLGSVTQRYVKKGRENNGTKNSECYTTTTDER